ncbi:hypothetical protein JK386_01800 [Nocardioides sp. zg-536]|uniref:Uncharacterized protein n=1 Tax=Nocardioides faecalis TaxID=2803858 RepID=A0A938Y295_9ACTN|nr:hypothetical protein [Nocardioides faecalis]MBM9458628.1 hypothetical protein [Nocardioides faecalis]MBS4752960.1 hypothetical protein [Nocardioides faecalis]QVI58626.1 hypothetical protein KG111_16890 [Nocardioides faecalis]
MDRLCLPQHWFPRLVVCFRTATSVAGLILLVGLAAFDLISAPQPSSPRETLGMRSGPLVKMMEIERCSPTGFDRSVVPRKAIVRTPDGDTELVSFKRGWAVFSGAADGDLVAVCLGRSARHRPASVLAP